MKFLLTQNLLGTWFAFSQAQKQMRRSSGELAVVLKSA